MASLKRPTTIDDLTTIYAWAEGRTQETIDWYLTRKTSRALWSKSLRALSIILGVGGGLVPLIHAANTSLVAAEWGFVLLAAAGGILLADRLFGFTSSWMRFMRTQAALQTLLAQFQAAYLAWLCRVSTEGTATDDQIDQLLTLIADLVSAAADQVAGETAAWSEDLKAEIEGALPHLGTNSTK